MKIAIRPNCSWYSLGFGLGTATAYNSGIAWIRFKVCNSTYFRKCYKATRRVARLLFNCSFFWSFWIDGKKLLNEISSTTSKLEGKNEKSENWWKKQSHLQGNDPLSISWREALKRNKCRTSAAEGLNNPRNNL